MIWRHGKPLVLLGVFLACLWLPFVTGAANWTGRVVAIHDGDTMTVLRYGRGVKLRLHAIDAPELAQPFGRQSRKSLSNLCYGRYARVESVGEDQYGRTLARVRCGGLEANAEQLRRGLAWHYTHYSLDPELQQLEAEARRQRLGLWSDRRAQPPWLYRHGKEARPAQPRESQSSTRFNRSCGAKRHCSEMTSCAEARFYLRQCGIRALDGDHDGIPCESLCAPPPD